MSQAASNAPSRLGQAAGFCAGVVDAVAAILVAVITLLVFAQVAVRYVLGGSLVWSEELTRVLFVWMVLLAATTAAPMRIDVLVAALPARAGAAVLVLGELVAAGLTGLLLWGAWQMADLTAFDRFTALDLSVSWQYYALVFSGALWLMGSAARVSTRLIGLSRQDHPA